MVQGVDQGLASLYLQGEPSVNYPPLYLALLVGLGKLQAWLQPDLRAGPLQIALIKLPAVLADLIVTVLLYLAAHRFSWSLISSSRSEGSSWAGMAVPGGEPDPIGEPISGSEGLTTRKSDEGVTAQGPVSPIWVALAIAALWALNPAVIYTSAYWGQVDSIHTMWMVAALVAALLGRWGWSGALAGLGLLTKLQAIVILPLLALLALRAGWRSLMRTGLATGLTVTAGVLPLVLSGAASPLWQVYRGAIGFYHRLTLDAFNLWWPLQYLGQRLLDRELSDDLRILGPVTLRWIGLALLMSYVALILWSLYRYQARPHSQELLEAGDSEAAPDPRLRRSLTDVMTPDVPVPTRPARDETHIHGQTAPSAPWALPAFFAAALLVFGFFMLPTEIHERYILPALAFLAPVAWQERRLLGLYLVLTVTVLLNLLEVLPFSPDLYAILSAVPGERLALAAINIALFAWLTWYYLSLSRLNARHNRDAQRLQR